MNSLYHGIELAVEDVQQWELSMKRRNLIAIAAVALSVSPTAPSTVFAASAGMNAPVHAMFGQTKTVHYTMRNDTTASMELKVGEDVVNLEAGKSLEVKLPPGSRIVANSTTPNHTAGSVIAEVSDSLNGAIIHVK